MIGACMLALPAALAAQGTTAMPGMSHDMSSHATADTAALTVVPDDPSLPADAAHAVARLSRSTRHGEYVMIPTAHGDSIRAWVVYPERRTKAPVVVVIHEIFGLTNWIRGVTDQLAAAGFIAIAPDMLTKQNFFGMPDSTLMQVAPRAISTLDPVTIQQYVDAAAHYGMSLPSALPRYGVVGFCWGGTASFAHAVHSPSLGASVVYYGTSPKSADLTAVNAPVLGLYGGNDARVGATVPPADSTMRALHKTYEPHMFDGAGHGFLRQQNAPGGANLAATRQAWPATIAWFHKYLGA